jgi:hypothetical protein
VHLVGLFIEVVIKLLPWRSQERDGLSSKQDKKLMQD